MVFFYNLNMLRVEYVTACVSFCIRVLIINVKMLAPHFPGLNSNLYYSPNMFVYIAGCFGQPVILNGFTETIGINATQY